MTTIGELIKAMETELFSDTHGSVFEKQCREREIKIKQFINIIAEMLHQLVSEPGSENLKISAWKKEKTKVCIKNLSDYTSELVSELDRDKIEKYCSDQSKFPFSRNVFDPNINLLIMNSYYGAIVADIYWVTDLTLHDALNISMGKLDINELGKRTPNKILEIEKLLLDKSLYFVDYSDHFDTIKEAFKCYSAKCYKAFNLLLLTSIEGITKKLGKYLVDKQELNIDVNSKSYNSLNAFLSQIPWKKDLPVSRTNLFLITGNYEWPDFNDPFQPLPMPMDKILISFDTKLGFLKRRFKENRDMILHGEETEYDKPFHGYLNISALLEVLVTTIKYRDLY